MNKSPPPQLLVIDERATDFGEVLETSTFYHKVPIKNVSDRALDVKLQKSCDCSDVSPSVLHLEPRETKTVEVTLDLLHNRHIHQGQPRRPYRAHLTAVYGSRGFEQAPIEMRGVVRAIIDISPPNLHLREDLVENEAGAEESVAIKPVMRLSWLTVKKSPAHLAARVEPTKDGFTLFVRPLANGRRGSFRDTIELEMADASNRQLPDQHVKVTGNVTGRFVAFPAETTFGMRTLGTTAEEVVRVVSRRGDRFTVEAVKAGESVVKMVRKGEYSVRQTFTRPELQRANVTFVLRDAGGKCHVSDYTATYYGTSGGSQP